MMPKRAAVTRPQPDEYAPYYETYVSLIPGDDIVGVLEAQRVQMAQLLAARSEREGNFRYAPDKWSVKEVIGHICDTERIFAYRLLRIARGDQTPLASFEQNDYIAPGAFGERTLAELAAEFAAVRAATIALVQSLKAEAWMRRGTASGKTVSARALAYIIAGHEVHHRNQFCHRSIDLCQRRHERANAIRARAHRLAVSTAAREFIFHKHSLHYGRA